MALRRIALCSLVLLVLSCSGLFPRTMASEEGVWSRVIGPWQNFDGSQFDPYTPAEYGMSYADLGLVVAMAKSDSNVFYVGAHNGDGLFKSVDGGNTWQNVSAGLPRRDKSRHLRGGEGPYRGISVIAIAPSDPETVYVGFQSDAAAAVTRDGGSHWRISRLSTRPTIVGDFSCLAIAIHPTAPGVAYVSHAAGTALLKTTNGGKSWASAGGLGLNHLPYDKRVGTGVSAIAIDPSDHNTVYAAGYSCAAPRSFNEQYWYAWGVHRSTDGGRHWYPDFEGWPLGGWWNGLLNDPITSIAFGGGSSQVMYLGESGGRAWARDCRNPEWWTEWWDVSDDLSLEGCSALCTSPTDPYVVFAAGRASRARSAVCKSTDKGQNWESVGTGWPSETEYTAPDRPYPTYVLTLSASSIDPDILWAGTTTGVYRYGPSPPSE